MRTIKLTIAYDGTRLVGWQRQREGDSVQALLEDALARFEGAPVTVQGAGRTDAGVHALGQVASAQLTASHSATALLRGLNAELPRDVRVLTVEDAPDDFHARFSSTRKCYCYVICRDAVASPFGRSYSWHLADSLDVAAMERATQAIVGHHDFAAFQSAGSDVRDSVRTIHRAEWRARAGSFAPTPLSCTDGSVAETGDGSWLIFEIEGDGFLRHMVRTIVGTLVEVGRGWRDVASVTALVAGGDRAHAGATAPAHGLFLVRVDYH
jgi:tRNA pseudouridine38-40 synthase